MRCELAIGEFEAAGANIISARAAFAVTRAGSQPVNHFCRIARDPTDGSRSP